MKILLKLYATLGDYLPSAARGNQVEIEVAETEAVADILARHKVPERLSHLVLVNGVFVPREERAVRRLAAGDTLAVWPPIAGG